MIVMMKVYDDDDGDGDNDGERLWWLLSREESYISQRSDVLWRFACGDVFSLENHPEVQKPALQKWGGYVWSIWTL